MAVIPLTLTISLCLVFTFVIFFLREQARPRFGSAESEALLPLAEETGRAVGSVPHSPRPPRVPQAVSQEMRRPARRVADRKESHRCGCRTGERPPCAGCLNHRAAI